MKREESGLFDLIKALSPSERRYLKLKLQFQDKLSQSYIRLFKVFEEAVQFDDKLMFSKVKQSIQNFNNYRVQKRYLYKVILREMRQYHNDNDIDRILETSKLDIYFLISKGLFKDGWSELNRAIKLAEKFQRFNQISEFLQIQYDLLQRTSKRIEYSQKFYPSEYDIQMLNFNHLQVLLARRVHLEVINIMRKGNTTWSQQSLQFQEYEKLRYSKCFQENIRVDSLEIYTIEFIIQQVYEEQKMLFIDKKIEWNKLYESCVGFIEKVINDQNLEILESFQSLYFTLLEHRLRLASRTSWEATYSSIEFINGANISHESLEIKKEMLVFKMQLRAAYLTGNPQKGVDFINKKSAFIKEIERYDFTEEIVAIYTVMIQVCLMNSNFKDVCIYGRKLILLGVEYEVSRTIVSAVYILLILLYSFQNDNKNFILTFNEGIDFINEGKENKTIMLLLGGAKEYIECKRNKKEEYLKSFADKLKLLDATLPENKILNTFDFQYWVESIAFNKPFSEVLLKRSNYGI